MSDVHMILQNEKHSNRTEWIDIAKGFLIILMVMGHAGAPFVPYIYLFHMPAFLFLSGYTFNGAKYTLKAFIVKKTTTLLFPTVIINLLFFLFYGFVNFFGYYNVLQPAGYSFVLIESLKAFVMNLSTTDFGGATWFIFVLYLTEIFFFCLYKLNQLIANGALYLNTLASMFFGMIGLYLSQNNFYYYNLDLALYALLYFALGEIFKAKNVFTQIDKRYMLPISLVLTVFFGSFYFKNSLAMNWPTRQFSDIAINLTAFFCAFYICYWVSQFISSSVLRALYIFIGRRTYAILVLHFFAFKTLYALEVVFNLKPKEYLKNFVPPYSNDLKWLFYATASIAICILISQFAKRFRILNFIFNAHITSRSK